MFVTVLDEYSLILSKREAVTDNTCTCTVVPIKSDSDDIFCLQLLSKSLSCTLHLS